MDLRVALIFLMLSSNACLVHTNSECSKPVLRDCQLNNVEVLRGLIDIQIRAALENVPVTKMLGFVVGDSRIVRVVELNVKSLVPSHTFDEVDISDPSQNATGANNIISYRPRYQDAADSDNGGSNPTAVVFINMREVFPCLKSLPGYRYHPICKIFTHEEDGFRSFRSIVEAADSGNQFRIFSTTSDIPTYGFGIQGCAEFTSDCLPTYHEFVIVCYSPC